MLLNKQHPEGGAVHVLLWINMVTLPRAKNTGQVSEVLVNATRTHIHVTRCRDVI